MAETLDELVPMVDIPAGKIGQWTVERYTVTPHEAALFNVSSYAGVGRRDLRPGTYTRLLRGNIAVMSDTPAERRDHAPVVRDAEGDVLVTGLGLGMVTDALLRRPAVRSVTVIEAEEAVIRLVSQTLLDRWGWAGVQPGGRLRIIHADAYTWKPNDKWDCAWHDIWDDICGDNIPLMGRLRRHYARRVRLWQRCWAERDCRLHHERDHRLDCAARAARRIHDITGEQPVIYNCDDAAVLVATGFRKVFR